MAKKIKKVITQQIKNRKIYWLAIILILAFGFFTRFLTYENVIVDNEVLLKGADAYHFVRQADNINNGGLPASDPLNCYPGGQYIQQQAAFYVYFLSFASRFMPLEFATAVFSPIFGLLVMAVIFLLMRELFPKNDYAVIGGTAIAALTGIQFIARSYFGFGDRHVLEVLTLSAGIFALVRSFNKDSLKWAVLASIFWALYAYTWIQSAMTISLIMSGIILTILIKTGIKQNCLKFSLVSLIFPILVEILTRNYMSLAILICTALALGISYIIRIKISKVFTRLIAVSLSVLGIILLTSLLAPEVTEKAVFILKGFFITDPNTPTTSEASPMWAIYSQIGFFNTVTIQWIFVLSGFIGMVYAIKEKNYFLSIFGIAFGILALLHIRFEYMYLISMAIGTGYIIAKHQKIFWVALALAFILTFSHWYNQMQLNNDSSLVFSRSDYHMAEWMRENLPQIGIVEKGDYPVYTPPDYAVLSDWDLSYLYSYISKKPFVASPDFCNYSIPSEFYLMQDEEQAYRFMKDRNYKYVLLKYMDLGRFLYEYEKMNMPPQKVPSGNIQGKKVYLVNQNYYSSMFARLYNFEGKAFEPSAVIILSRDNKLSQTDNYEQALIQTETSDGNLYSIDPLMSSVRLFELKHFKLIHSEGDFSNGVKLFQVVD